MTKNYVVAGYKPWNRRVFDEIISRYPGNWRYIDQAASLTCDALRPLEPRYVFFLHWSWKVPADLLDEFECVCFHMTDVPYGRGGSPLQNLIVRGHRQTKLTALRMVEAFDAGPVYLKEPLSLEGNAEEILIRSSHLAAKMIGQIVEDEPAPAPQIGGPVHFHRRKPADSHLPEVTRLEEVYDFIRMLDAEGYPRAFIEYGGFRIEFSRAALYDQRIAADVTITPIEPKTP
ncbi:MAG: hypothetical protein R2873_36030 [Caldilineaceae bacterium]